MTIKQDGFCGIFHAAKKAVDVSKVVIVLGGSEGNEKIPLEVGKMFADEGISALGICYWNVEGLPDSLIKVPLEPFEKAVAWLRKNGFSHIYIYGISKGAELALLCASLIPEIQGVMALSPSHCVWAGIKGNGGLLSKSFEKKSEFTWRGKELPCVVSKADYMGLIINLLRQRQINMSFMYEKALVNFDEQCAIKVENIKGNILFLYPEDDTMWPSKASVAYMKKRLAEKHFPYKVEAIGYEKASHIIVPLNPSKLKMFRVERQYPMACANNRKDAFQRCIQWLNAQ